MELWLFVNLWNNDYYEKKEMKLQFFGKGFFMSKKKIVLHLLKMFCASMSARRRCWHYLGCKNKYCVDFVQDTLL